ncbi:MAG: hypothetical protein KIS91_09645 [Anaerolineae bacterium]|nr:hypothetical protein [Anaerolineae bacterium]
MSETQASADQAAGAVEQSSQQTLAALGKVASAVPGRTRLRLKPELRTPETAAKVQAQLASHEDVDEVTVNPRTGSVLITHAKHRRGEAIFLEACQEAELIGEAVLDLPDDSSEADGGEADKDEGDRFAKLDQQMADLVYKTDYAVWKKTGLHFRGQLLAGSIAGLGVVQIALFGISLEMLPGPLLLWIAWDIYHREAKEPPFEERFAEEEAATAEPQGEASTAATA